MTGSAKDLEYLSMWQYLKTRYNISISRDLLVTLVKNIGPEGSVKNLPRDVFGVPASLWDQIIGGMQNIIT